MRPNRNDTRLGYTHGIYTNRKRDKRYRNELQLDNENCSNSNLIKETRAELGRIGTQWAMGSWYCRDA